MPAGGLRLHAGPPELLYRAAITYCVDHTVPSTRLAPPSDRSSAGRLSVSLVSRPGVFMGFAGFGGEQNEARLDLSPVVPQRLDLTLGEGESVIDLTGIPLKGLRLVSGAGDVRVVFGSPNREATDPITVEDTIGDIGIDRLGNSGAASVLVKGGLGTLEVDLSGHWEKGGARSASVRIEAAVGDLLLTLPAHEPALGVRLSVGSHWRDRLDPPGYHRDGDVFLSEGYDGATTLLDVDVLPGIGELVLGGAGWSIETGKGTVTEKGTVMGKGTGGTGRMGTIGAIRTIGTKETM